MLPLAEFTPLSPSAQLAIVSLLATVLAVLNTLSFFKRKPPLDSELVRLNAAIGGLKEAVDKLGKAADDHASHATEIEQLKAQVQTLTKQREEDARSQRTYTRETSHEIFKKLDDIAKSFADKVDQVGTRFTDKVEKVSASFASNVQQMEGTLDRLEGTADQLSKRLDNLER